MEAQWWVVLVVVGIAVAVVAYVRLGRTRERTAQEHRISGQAQRQADLPGDRISQREDRRLAGMTAEDREWEQASLGRNRDTQARAGKPEGPDAP